MTTYHICSVRDRQLDAYAQPIFTPTIGIAIRSFSDEVNRSDATNPLHKHPEDYDLYTLGTYEDHDGSFVPLTPPKLLTTALQVRQ